jgi:hypothetical protein
MTVIRTRLIKFGNSNEIRAHSNEILNIWETGGIQLYFQQDQDWFYRIEERRWITMNDNSSWRMIERVNGKTKRSLLHIAWFQEGPILFFTELTRLLLNRHN